MTGRSMDYYITVVIYLMLKKPYCSGTTGPGLSCVPPDAVNASDAAIVCEGRGCDDPVVLDHQDELTLEGAMVDSNFSTAWLPQRRVRFSTWKWMDNVSVRSELANQNWRDFMNCGLFFLKEKRIEFDDCTKDSYGFLCEVQGNQASSCSEVTFSRRDCLEVEGKILYYGCCASNWYDARWRCQKMGMRLAITREPLWQTMYNAWKDRSCERFWVGARREEWAFHGEEADDQKRRPVYWLKGEPAHSGDCAVVARGDSGLFGWRAAECTEQHHQVCQSQEIDVTTTGEEVTTGSDVEDPAVAERKGTPRETMSAYSAAVTLGILCIILLVVVGILSYKLCALKPAKELSSIRRVFQATFNRKRTSPAQDAC